MGDKKVMRRSTYVVDDVASSLVVHRIDDFARGKYQIPNSGRRD